MAAEPLPEDAASWLARGVRLLLLCALGILAVYAEAAPLGLSATAQPSPDLLILVVGYWSLRRPGSAPMLAIFGLGLFRDLVTDLPVGAGALGLVLASEALKRNRATLSRLAFPLEWGAVAVAAGATILAQWLVVSVTLAPGPMTTDLLRQWLYTLAAYPFVSLVLRWGLGIRWQKSEAG